MLDYNKICEGTSFYRTVSEIYFTNRLKRKIKDIFDKTIENKKKIKVLDMGCYIGTDIFMLGLNNKNIDFYGIDISKNAIKRAKELARFRNFKNVKFKVGDLNKKLPYKNCFFDVILCSEVIEHIKDPEKLIKQCYLKLKKGGTLIITTPNKNQLIEKLKLNKIINIDKYRAYEFYRLGKNITKEVWDEEGHISVMSNKELVSLLKRNNFKITKNEGVAIFGGNSFFDNHLTLLGIIILLDSIFHRFRILDAGIIISAKKI